MCKLASHADLCYNKLIKLFDHSGASNTLRSDCNLFERSQYGYSIPFLSTWQALPYLPLGRRKETTMPLQKGTPEHDAWRAKIAASHRGKPNSRKGKKNTPEHNSKITASKMGHSVSTETRAKLSNAFKGKERGPVAAETREKLSKANKGRKISDAHRARLRGRNVSAEARAKSSLSHKLYWQQATEEQRELMVVNWINAAKDKKNTTIEQFIATKLDLQNIVYEREKRIGNFWVDFYIASENRVIEVNGCYWHGCEQCGFQAPEHLEKREKDAKRYERLRSKGYVVDVLWEHDLRKEMEGL